MKRFLFIVGLCAALSAGTVNIATALEEQRMGGGPASAGAPAAAAVPGAAGNTGSDVKPADTGTEIRIPGLGKLGTLPKMDFGLDLLYGAADEPAETEVKTPGATPDDLTIRGSVRHRF